MPVTRFGHMPHRCRSHLVGRLKTREWKKGPNLQGVENAGLQKAENHVLGTSCVWVAKRNIINVVRGCVRVVLERMCCTSEQISGILGHLQSSLRLLTVKPMLAVSAGELRFDARRSASTSSTTHESRPVYVGSTTTSYVYTRLEFLKAVSHNMGAHRCDPYILKQRIHPTMTKQASKSYLQCGHQHGFIDI